MQHLYCKPKNVLTWLGRFIMPSLALVNSPSVLAYHTQTASLGAFAGSLLGPVGVLADFVATGSFIIGITVLFAALNRYLRHRVNPLATPMSTVLLLILIGSLLIVLPLTYRLFGDAIPYSFYGFTMHHF